MLQSSMMDILQPAPIFVGKNIGFPVGCPFIEPPIVMASPSPSDLRSEDPVQRYPPEPMRPKARLRLRELSLESVVREVHGRFHGYNTHTYTHTYIYIHTYVYIYICVCVIIYISNTQYIYNIYRERDNYIM